MSAASDERTNLPRKGPIAFTARLCSQRRAEACGTFTTVRCKIPSRNDVLIASAGSLSTRSPKSTGILQSLWRPFASGRTHSRVSTASRRIFFPSFLPTSPPKRTGSMPPLCAVIGVESSDTARYGHNFFSEKARSMCRPSSNAQRVCTGYHRPSHCSCWHHNTDCLSRPANCIPRIRGKLLEGHYSVL